MKTRGGTYGTDNINTPPLDSHFQKRSSTPRLFKPVDGVKDDAVESKADQALTVEKIRTTSDDTAQTNTTDEATTTLTKPNQPIVEKETVDPPLNSETVDPDSKEDVSSTNVLSVDREVNDTEEVITKKENDEDPPKAKELDRTDDVSEHPTTDPRDSGRNPRDSGGKPHHQRSKDRRCSSKDRRSRTDNRRSY